MQTDLQLNEMLSALPDQFTFYHLGEVARTEVSTPHRDIVPDDSLGLVYRFSGEIRGLFILVIDCNLDHSVYSELGNVIASQVATELSRKDNRWVALSPPHSLNATQTTDLMARGEFQQVDYIHNLAGRSVLLRAFMMATPTEEEAHA